MSDHLNEIRAAFFVECEELLEALFDSLGALSSGSFDDEVIHVAFRAVHSIKGSAGEFSLNELGKFSHNFEGLLDQIRDGNLKITDQLVELLFQCADTLNDIVAQSGSGASIDRVQMDRVCAQISEYMADPEHGLKLTSKHLPLECHEWQNFRIEFRPVSELYTSGNEPLYLLRSLQNLGNCQVSITHQKRNLFGHNPEFGGLFWTISLSTEVSKSEILDVFDFVDGLCDLEIHELGAEVNGSPIETQSTRPGTNGEAQGSGPTELKHNQVGSPVNSTIRVDLSRIDRLMNLVGELVINQAMLSQSVADTSLAEQSRLSSALDEFHQLTRDIQESVMLIRAQPIKSLFQRMGRVVREASAEAGKTIVLKTEGDSTEVDKIVLESLTEPLTHMIRNAIDHGVETTEERRASNKSETATIGLSAAHQSGRVVIEVSDDGKGLNRSRIRDKAVERKLLSEDAQPTDSELDRMLFLPGFSTANKVTELSGRGVGLDVVSSTISGLGGDIAVTTKAGTGTTFSISLPLTLAILDGMVIQAGNETLVIPLSAISETIAIGPSDIREVGRGNKVLSVRGHMTRVVDLSVTLGFNPVRPSFNGCIALLVEPENQPRTAIIVDAILDQRQVVIKGLQNGYGDCPGISAATILGNGRIALILDAAELLENSHLSGSKRHPVLSEAC